LYGGTERVVSYLTEELVRLGHDVTLFASGDSVTGARLIAPCPRALRLIDDKYDALAEHLVELQLLAAELQDFDVVHYHLDYLHFPLCGQLDVAQVTTLHGRLDRADLRTLFRQFDRVPLVSISHAQRFPIPWANWVRTVHHGLPATLHTVRPTQGDYLAFLGRVSPEKGLHRAIEIARLVGLPLKIAAKIDPRDVPFFEQHIVPLLKAPQFEWLGEIGGEAKDEFLGSAKALLFPIDWPEPFGLVMIEAMACGTPVIAYPRGAVPEIIEDGLTGFIVSDVESAVEAVPRALELDRAAIRGRFEERFSATRMARDYVRVYERVRLQHDYLGERITASPAMHHDAPD
jgi:glycosyltransferase involved in cell wall biosynthesis